MSSDKGASASGPRGRGAILAQLAERHRLLQESKGIGGGGGDGGEPEEKIPPQCRGRAAFLKRFRELKSVGTEQKLEPTASTSVQPEETTTALEKLALSESKEPCYFRGVTGKPVRVSANYLQLEIEQDRAVYEYEVRFQPEVDSKSNRIKLVNMALGELKSTKIYDSGSLLCLPIQICDIRKECMAKLPTAEQQIKVILIFKRRKRFSESLHVCNVLFKRIMNILLYKQMGRNYFDLERKYILPQHKLEIFPGYAISCMERENGLLICLDTQHRVIRTQTAYELLEEIVQANPTNYKEVAVQSLIGACVLTKYNNKTYIVDDIAWNMSPKDSFDVRGGAKITFIKYYKDNYGLGINDDKQPLLISRKPKNINGEKVEQMVCLIPELCYLTGMTDIMRQDHKVMKDVASYTRLTPAQRQLAIRNYIENIQKNQQAQNILNEWGLKLPRDTIQLNARQLPTETIHFGDKKRLINGDWNRDMGDSKCTGPIDINNWIIFCTARDRRFTQSFIELALKLANGMGCRINEPKMIILQDDRNETWRNMCSRSAQRETQVAVFIFPNIRDDRYATIKKLCSVEMPLASQVILSKTLSNQTRIRSVVQKIMLQINCKLGGTLWHIPIPLERLMVCGIDVYHSKERNNSVCGFVASINDSITKWYSHGIFQTAEIGDFFIKSFESVLKQYKILNKCYPTRVVIYRDGVSHGQFAHTEQYELKQFQDVISRLNLDIKLTFIIVVKRISTRIFAINDRNIENPNAGTIVDCDITERNLYDFYLIPQSTRQGTVSPTHYVVLYDSAKMKADHIQRLTYKLCHLYYNWCGTISVPAPCQYAHKLAQIMGQVIKKTPHPDLDFLLYYL